MIISLLFLLLGICAGIQIHIYLMKKHFDGKTFVQSRDDIFINFSERNPEIIEDKHLASKVAEALPDYVSSIVDIESGQVFIRVDYNIEKFYEQETEEDENFEF